MCGICLALLESSYPDVKTSFSFSEWLETIGLSESMRRRGPDHFDIHSCRLDPNRTLYGAASVLHVRGSGSMAKQPVVDETDERGSFLLFNGEIYDGLGVELTEDSNDTVLLYEHLQRVSKTVPEESKETVSLFAELQGEYAIIYFDALHHRLWFCRDAFGRRSLLYSTSSPSPADAPSTTNIKLLLSSVSTRSSSSTVQHHHHTSFNWAELPAGYVFRLDFDLKESLNEELVVYRLRPTPTSDDLQNLVSAFKRYRLIEIDSTSWYGLFHLNRQPRCSPISAFGSDDLFEQWFLEQYQAAVDGFLIELRKAVQKRTNLLAKFCHDYSNGDGSRHPKIALLFSGGVDSLLLAVLLAEELGEGNCVDLLNVAFGNSPAIAPDRITGLAAFNELQRLYPWCQKWRFVQIDVNQSELAEWRQNRIAQLVLPSETVLDDSIGCVLWFAARGIGKTVLDGDTLQEEASCTCPCRVLFLGSGADELLAGYSRHRKRYFDVHDEERRDSALIDELEMELRRIGSRNLARDDRVVADHGRETRLPYLDEQFVKYVNGLPLEAKCDLRQRRGLGEKLLLRMALRKMGVGSAFYRLPKRAMQFGSRIAKAENRKEKGGDRCDRLLLNGDYD